jgi:hypothetical protein
MKMPIVKPAIFPILPSKVGKMGKLIMPPDNKVIHFEITGEIRVPQTGVPEKILCLHRIKFVEDNRVEIRVGYYIIGKLPKMKGKWVWGQFAALIPIKDFKALIRKAEKQGWF